MKLGNIMVFIIVAHLIALPILWEWRVLVAIELLLEVFSVVAGYMLLEGQIRRERFHPIDEVPLSPQQAAPKTPGNQYFQGYQQQ